MTTFTGMFNYPATNRPDLGSTSVSASGTLSFSFNADAGAGARAGFIWSSISGNGSISNYTVSAAGKSGFPHTRSAAVTASLGTFLFGAPDINDLWGVSGSGWNDSVWFDGSLDQNGNGFPDLRSDTTNGLNLDGTTITGRVRIDTSILPGVPDVVVPITLKGPAVPTLFNLAEMSRDVENPTSIPSNIKDTSSPSNNAWTPSPFSNLQQTDPTGEFQAFTYVNSDSSQVVIAFRGTVFDFNDLSTTFKTITTDIASFPSGIPTLGLVKTMQYAASLLADVVQRYPNAHITLTGHSLGGAVAQMLGTASGYSTVAFNAPGAAEIYNSNSMRSVLASTVQLGIQDPDPGLNVNVRNIGDWVSMQGVQFSIPVTITPPSNLPLPYLDSPLFILQNHDLNTIITELKTPGTTIFPGIVENDAFILAGTQFIQHVVLKKTVVEAVFLISYVANAVANLIDPAFGTQFIYAESGNSPDLASVSFVSDPNASSFKLWTQVGGAWSAPQTVQAGQVVSLPAGTRVIKYEGLSSGGQPVVLPDGYMFAATTASSGQVTAKLHSLNLDNFNGVNVQTPTAGQTTLTVNSSFAYTDAGNGALTINGTPSGNDTILLGSGNKTVNLGSGNDFVMVKAGATGNIVIHGGSGDETILAGAANVTLIAGTGGILFIGGDDANANLGSDTIDYSALAGGVQLNLATGVIQNSKRRPRDADQHRECGRLAICRPDHGRLSRKSARRWCRQRYSYRRSRQRYPRWRPRPRHSRIRWPALGLYPHEFGGREGPCLWARWPRYAQHDRAFAIQ